MNPENTPTTMTQNGNAPDPADPTADSIVIPNRVLTGGTAVTGGDVFGEHAYIIKKDDASEAFKFDSYLNLLAMQLYNPHGATTSHPWVIASDLEKFVEGIYELR